MEIRLSVWLKALLNLVYPPTCCVCGGKLTENNGLCLNCTSKIHKNDCGIAACRYEGILKESIHLFKYKGITPLCRTFSRLLLDFIERNIDMKKIDMIIPIPLHAARFRQRGFNQAHLLSLPIAEKYNMSISAANLIKKPAEPQSGLNRTRRLQNLKNVFSVRRPHLLKGKNILLVDDVYTTGATINSASRALKKDGAASIKAVALARGA